MAYQLYYWPGIQGRGEFVRLALEESRAEYVDVMRVHETTALMNGDAARPSFAPPFLVDGDVIVGQTAAILLYLGPRLGLAPADEVGRLWTHQIQLTITDLVAEAHDTHHPIAASLYYDQQKREAKRRASDFREDRMPAFLAWFELILAHNPAGDRHLVGESLTYADLSLFQVVEGLTYAFPRAMARLMPSHLRVSALHAAVASRPNVRAYLDSPRRLPFSTDDVFRHYPELDG